MTTNLRARTQGGNARRPAETGLRPATEATRGIRRHDSPYMRLLTESQGDGSVMTNDHKRYYKRGEHW